MTRKLPLSSVIGINHNGHPTQIHRKQTYNKQQKFNVNGKFQLITHQIILGQANQLGITKYVKNANIPKYQ